jgi:predicted MFS family arabinose efflux permease
MFFAGAAIMASAAFMLSLAQFISTDAMRGRVMSVYNLAFRAGIPIGSLGLGKLIPAFGVSKSLAGAGIALTGLSLYFLVSRKDETFSSSHSIDL